MNLETQSSDDSVRISFATPPEAEPTQLIARNLIHPWPGNPRKHFDPGKIMQLAASIAAKGVLQNLVVRPHPEIAGEYQIAAGESRWRAAGEIIEAGNASVGMELPCRVQDLSDRDMLEMALAENIQRADLTPLEEAEGFKRLTEIGVGTDEIADRIGKSRRYVQLRLDLVERLHPKAQAALREGTINTEQARVLTRAPEKRQAEVLKQVREDLRVEPDRPVTAEQIADMVRETLIPVTAARFEPSLYTGELVAMDDEPEEKFFADVGQFEKLQRDWLKTERTKLAENWDKIYEHTEKHANLDGDDNRLPHEFTKADKGDKKAGALIVHGANHTIAIFEGVKKNDHTSGYRPVKQSAGAGVPQPELTKAFLAHCRNRKTMTLQEAVAADPDTAKRALCLALMNGTRAVHLKVDRPLVDDQVLSAAVRERAAKLRLLFPAGTLEAPDPEGWSPAMELKDATGYGNDYGRCSPTAERAAAAALGMMSSQRLDELLAVLVAPMVGSFNRYAPELGDCGPVLELATSANAEVRHAESFTLDDAFLGKCRMAQLTRIALDLNKLGIPCAAGGTGPKARAAILAVADQAAAKKYVPVWAQFGTEDEIKYLAKPEKIAASQAVVDKAVKRMKAAATKAKPAAKKKPAKPASATAAKKKPAKLAAKKEVTKRAKNGGKA